METSSVEIRQSEGRGLGVFACKDFQEGELLLCEDPLVLLTVPHTPKTLAKFIGQLRKEVKRLEEDEQEQFFSLHNARPELCTKARDDLMMVSIYQANSVQLREFDKLRGKDLGSAVFNEISRINHSCCPNSVLSYNLETKQCEVSR